MNTTIVSLLYQICTWEVNTESPVFIYSLERMFGLTHASTPHIRTPAHTIEPCYCNEVG